MDENTIDLYARLSLHEYLLEIAFANALGQLDAPGIENFMKDTMKGIRFKTWTGSEDADSAMLLQQAMIRIGERFFEKVRRRLPAAG